MRRRTFPATYIPNTPDISKKREAGSGELAVEAEKVPGVPIANVSDPKEVASPLNVMVAFGTGPTTDVKSNPASAAPEAPPRSESVPKPTMDEPGTAYT